MNNLLNFELPISVWMISVLSLLFLIYYVISTAKKSQKKDEELEKKSDDFRTRFDRVTEDSLKELSERAKELHGALAVKPKTSAPKPYTAPVSSIRRADSAPSTSSNGGYPDLFNQAVYANTYFGNTQHAAVDHTSTSHNTTSHCGGGSNDTSSYGDSSGGSSICSSD